MNGSVTDIATGASAGRPSLFGAGTDADEGIRLLGVPPSTPSPGWLRRAGARWMAAAAAAAVLAFGTAWIVVGLPEEDAEAPASTLAASVQHSAPAREAAGARPAESAAGLRGPAEISMIEDTSLAPEGVGVPPPAAPTAAAEVAHAAAAAASTPGHAPPPVQRAAAASPAKPGKSNASKAVSSAAEKPARGGRAQAADTDVLLLEALVRIGRHESARPDAAPPQGKR